MNRKTFLASLAGLLALPKVLKSEPKYPPISNKDFFLPMDVMKEAYELKNPLETEGWMEIGDGEITIYSKNKIARVGDVVATTVSDPLWVKDYEEATTSLQVFETFRRTRRLVLHDDLRHQYLLREPKRPKEICGVPVIKIHGKYRQYRAGKHELIKIQFTPIMSTFRES